MAAPLVRQPAEVTNLINLVNTHLSWTNLNGPPRGYEIYHPSAFGQCLRKMQYQRYEERGLITSKPSAPESRMVRIWDTGHSMHDRWANYFEEIGVLRGVWECSNPECQAWEQRGLLRQEIREMNPGYKKAAFIPEGTDLHENFEKYQAWLLINPPRKYGKDNKIGCFKPDVCVCGCDKFVYHEVSVIDEALNFHGHADQILDFSNFDPEIYSSGNSVPILFKPEDLPKKPIVVDMKTVNSFKFKKKLGNTPDFHYKVQITIYVNVLDLDYGVIIYENKDDCATRVYQVGKNPKMWAKIQEQAKQMNSMVDKKLLPPPRPTNKDNFDCKYCDFSSICHESKVWDDPNLDAKRLKFYGDFE